MATNKDTENSTPSAPTPADSDIAKLTEVTEQDLVEAIEDEYDAEYSKESKRLLKAPEDFSHYYIKEGTGIICKNAFCVCNNLVTITIPPSVTAIGGTVFFGCSSLTSITIPLSVIAIGGSAFSWCSCLTSITIPQSVTAIGKRAFIRCPNLDDTTKSEISGRFGDKVFGGFWKISLPKHRVT